MLPFFPISYHARIAISSLLLQLTNVAYAGVDRTIYDDAPTFFLGWETSFFFYSSNCIVWLVMDINR